MTSGYSCVEEVTDEDERDQEVMAVLSLDIMPEIIRPIEGFVDGVVLLMHSSDYFSAISFSRCRAVSFWVSKNDDGRVRQN